MLPRYLVPSTVLLCAIGVYSTNNTNTNSFDIWGVDACGVTSDERRVTSDGFAKLSCELVPLLLDFIARPVGQKNLRWALLRSRGDYSGLVTRAFVCSLVGSGVAGDDDRVAVVAQKRAQRGFR